MGHILQPKDNVRFNMIPALVGLAGKYKHAFDATLYTIFPTDRIALVSGETTNPHALHDAVMRDLCIFKRCALE